MSPPSSLLGTGHLLHAFQIVLDFNLSKLLFLEQEDEHEDEEDEEEEKGPCFAAGRTKKKATKKSVAMVHASH